MRRPDDGNLMLYSAGMLARHGNAEKARLLVKAAAGNAHPAQWLRTAATLSSYSGELTEALVHWREVLRTQPLAMDAHEAVTRLTAQTQSTAAALTHLEAACAKFPSYFPLAQLRIGWLRREDEEGAARALAELVAQRPLDAWARRELALVLCELRRFTDARDEAAWGLRLDPNSPISHYVQGGVLNGLNQVEEARQCWRKSITLSVDYQFAITALVDSFPAASSRRAALRFVQSELVRQVIFGEGLLAYRTQASDTLAPAELLADLREALAARPDLWHAWSAVIGQLESMDRLDEALELARQATGRYPLVPRIWMDLARVSRIRGDLAGEIEAMRECLRISPGWLMASRQLADALIRQGDLTQAQKVMRSAIARDPLDAVNYWSFAGILWRLGKHQAAIVRTKQAVLMDPGLTGAWDTLRRWTAQRKRTDEAVELARRLTVRRAGEARSWLVLARMLGGEAALDDRLAACDKALSLNPRSVEAADLKAVLLTQAKRYEHAMDACKLEAYGDHPPPPLRGRAAWVMAECGDRDGAIVLMKSVLRDETTYFWGWRTLCEWLAADKEPERLLQAAQEMAGHFPNNVEALNILADAQIRSKNRDGGKATLARVLAISPVNEFAAFRLFDVQLEDSQLDAAPRTLELLLKHQNGKWAQQRQIALAVRRGDKEEAAREFSAASKWALTDPAPFNAAIKDLDKAGLGSIVDTALMASVESSLGETVAAGSARLCETWMQRCVARRRWRESGKFLKKLRGRREEWLAAVVPYLNGLAAAKKYDSVRRILRRHRPDLKSDTRAWGTMGYALMNSARYRSQQKIVSKWMADYASRTDAQAWMLINLAGSLRGMGRDRQARAVSEYALKLSQDHTADWHVIWLALDESIASQPGEGVRRFAAIDWTKLPAVQKFLANLATAVIELDRIMPQSRKAALDAAAVALKAAKRAHPTYHRSRMLRSANRRTAWRVARTAGGLKLWLWAVRQTL
jgi:tetratricopeptide (TPR) repeat protein